MKSLYSTITLAIAAALCLDHSAAGQVLGDTCANAETFTVSATGNLGTSFVPDTVMDSGQSACEPAPTVDYWFEITSPGDGILTSRARSTVDPTGVAIYEDCTGTLLDCTPPVVIDSAIGFIPVSAGDVRYVRVMTEIPVTPSASVSFEAQYDEIPTFQSCQTARTADGLFNASFESYAASASGVMSSCDTGVAEDLWFAFTSPVDLTVGFSVVAFDPGFAGIAAYDSCMNPTELGCSIEGGASPELSVLAGSTTYFRVFSDPNELQIQVFEIEDPSPGDTCATAPVVAAEPLTSVPLPTSGDGITASPNQPTCAAPDELDFWFRYTTSVSGIYSMYYDADGVRPSLAVFDDCGGVEISCTRAEFADAVTLSFASTAGTEYVIRAANETNARGFLLIRSPGFLDSQESCGTAPAIVSQFQTWPVWGPVSSTAPPSTCDLDVTYESWFELSSNSNGLLRTRVKPENSSCRVSVLDSCGGSELACEVSYYGNGVDLDLMLSPSTPYLLRVQTSLPDTVRFESAPSSAPNLAGVLRPAGGDTRTVQFGDIFDVDFELENLFGLPLGGWAYTVGYDPTRLELLDVTAADWVGILPPGVPGAINEVRPLDLQQGTGALFVQLLTPTGDIGIDAALDPAVGSLTFRSLMPADESTTVAVVDGTLSAAPGGPPVAAGVVFASPAGAEVFEFGSGLDAENLTVIAAAAPQFLRGRCFSSGTSIGMSEVIQQLQFIFSGGDSPPCLDACDLNDDGIVSLADPLILISALFSGSSTAALLGDDCGDDMTVDELSCDESTPACE